MVVALVLLGAVLNALAQIAMKASVAGLGHLGPRELLAAAPRLMTNPVMIGALLLYVASLVNWLMVISRLDLTVAYPLMSLAYIVTFLAGVAFFGEPVTWSRVAGTLAIGLGVVLICRPTATST